MAELEGHTLTLTVPESSGAVVVKSGAFTVRTSDNAGGNVREYVGVVTPMRGLAAAASSPPLGWSPTTTSAPQRSARAPRSRRSRGTTRSRSPGRSTGADDADPEPPPLELAANVALLNALCSESLDRGDWEAA